MPKMFWEDYQQAVERVAQTYVMYDGHLVYMQELVDGEKPYAHLVEYPSMKKFRAYLDDEKFRDFRPKVPTGWFNSITYHRALYFERRPLRRQKHGVDNTSIYVTDSSKRQIVKFSDAIVDKAYDEFLSNTFPKMGETLDIIKNTSTIAISRRYAIERDDVGLRWLLRNRDRVGLFSGGDSLLLLQGRAYLKEEIAECRELPLGSVKEF